MIPAMFNALVKRYVEEQKVEDYRAGVVASLVANSCRDPKKRPQPFMPKDFFPSLEAKIEKEKPRQTAAEQIATAAAITKLLGGTDLRKKKRKRADKRS
jgi:hypothetical protein